jgi:cytochrome c5
VLGQALVECESGERSVSFESRGFWAVRLETAHRFQRVRHDLSGRNNAAATGFADRIHGSDRLRTLGTRYSNAKTVDQQISRQKKKLEKKSKKTFDVLNVTCQMVHRTEISGMPNCRKLNLAVAGFPQTSAGILNLKKTVTGFNSEEG